MSSAKLIRWSGLSAVVGGALLVILSILESILFRGQTTSVAMASSAWVLVEIVFIIAELLVILGLVGLYAQQLEETGNMGFVAFLLSFAGTVMISGTEWGAAFMAPWMAGSSSAELLDAEPAGIFMVGILITFVLFTLGWFLFGLTSQRAGVLSRSASVLLMVGAISFLVMGFLDIGFEGVVFGAALAWLGYGLWSGAGMSAATAIA